MDSPGVGAYNLNEKWIRASSIAASIKGAARFDEYSFYRDSSKSPGPVYQYKRNGDAFDEKKKDIVSSRSLIASLYFQEEKDLSNQVP
jgi:hypothetical protein